VSAVTQDRTGVTVSAAGTAYRADACVLAAPLPALRAVRFSPALPTALAGAVAHLQYGTGAKVALQYSSRPWITQGFNGDTFTDLGISTTWDATDAQPERQGILLVYTMGSPGAASMALDDPQRIATAAADLNRIYPGSRAALVTARTFASNDQRYTGGTYTAYAPGQVVAYWRALRRPVGRVVLAGEHTDALTGYMEGAARSGIRAAAKVRQFTG
jgi:monoamine oxidase